MSQENVEIVRQGMEAWNAGDLDAALGLVGDEIVTRRVPPLPDPGEWHGHDGLLAVVADWAQAFDGYEQTAEEYLVSLDMYRTREQAFEAAGLAGAGT
jgi:ketosteroid isomerase-like protein